MSCEKSKSNDNSLPQTINPALILSVFLDSQRTDIDFIYSRTDRSLADVSAYEVYKRFVCTGRIETIVIYFDPSKDEKGNVDWIELCMIEIPAAPCDKKVLNITYNFSSSVSAECKISDRLN